MAGTVPLTAFKSGTSKNMLLGAGTAHIGLTWAGSKWNFDESLYVATSGGNKFEYSENIYEAKVDGVLVRMEGLDFKNGETAAIEIIPSEITEDMLKHSMHLEAGVSEDSTMNMYTTKGTIEAGDYVDNFAFVGVRGDGKPIIIIFERALCVSGLSTEHKDDAITTPTLRFVCVAKPDGDPRKLPIKIYYPKSL